MNERTNDEPVCPLTGRPWATCDCVDCRADGKKQLPFERSTDEMNRIAKAARVSRFMKDDAEVGRWRLKHFTINEAHYRHSAAVAIAQGGAQGEMRLERTIPPGEYVTLVRKATAGELEDIRDEKVVDAFVPGDEDWHSGYVPIMSDTPSEIFEHGHAFRNAHGRVLITGLGLGCLVAALLSTEEVEHITVVEIDKDVIELTGHYYAGDPRVTIVNDDAIRFAANYEGPDFDYAWHDIWSHISPRNLDDDSLAEHGISYETMFMMYEAFVNIQGAWAYPEALKMRMHEEDERERLHEWTRNFIAEEDPKVREDMLVTFHIHRHFPQIPLGEIIPPEVVKFFEEHMDVREGVRQQMSERDMVTDLAELLDEEIEHPMEPMHRPNEDPEANVA